MSRIPAEAHAPPAMGAYSAHRIHSARKVRSVHKNLTARP